MDDLLNEFETPQPASSMMRWLACFVDYLMCVLAIGIIFRMLGDFPFIAGNDDEIALLNQVIRIAVFVIPWLLLLPVYETINKGQTFGKAMFNVKALNHDGSKLDFGRSIVRHLFDIIDFLPVGGLVGLASANSNKNAQRIGDLVAKTIVVATTWNGK